MKGLSLAVAASALIGGLAVAAPSMTDRDMQRGAI